MWRVPTLGRSLSPILAGPQTYIWEKPFPCVQELSHTLKLPPILAAWDEANVGDTQMSQWLGRRRRLCQGLRDPLRLSCERPTACSSCIRWHGLTSHEVRCGTPSTSKKSFLFKSQMLYTTSFSNTRVAKSRSAQHIVPTYTPPGKNTSCFLPMHMISWTTFLIRALIT